MLTPEQERAAHADTSIAVVAGAGTGKTHMLAHRYLYHLRRGFSPLQIVAVTFTERAADELRSRIREEVRGAEDLETRAAVLAELEAAQISTIHALAARICRDHPDLAEVPADFKIQDELETALVEAENIEDALATLPAAMFEIIPYSRLKTALQALLKDPVQAGRAFTRDPSGWSELLKANSDRVLAELLSGEQWEKACGLLRGTKGDDSDKLEPIRQAAVRAVELLACLEFEEADLLFETIKLNVGSQKNWPGGKETLGEVKAELKVLRELYKVARDDDLLTLELGPFDDELARVLEVLEAAFSRVLTHLAAKRGENRQLDYADLEVHALRALEHDTVKAHYHSRWQAFLVDEFQDTNPVQEEILSALTENSLLTIVGDEKQAIYGFRGADVRVFRSFKERIVAAGGREETLSESFRAHARLVEAVNGCFGPVFLGEHQPLSANRREAPHEAPHLEALTVTDENGEGNRAARQVMEARTLGKRLKNLIDSGLLVFDRESAGVRPVEPGDIAILTRTWRPLDVYDEILPAMGVPTAHIGGGNLLETREAQDAWALLRWLAEPDDDVALVTVLRSPYFAVSDPALYRLLADKADDEPWWEAAKRAQDARIGRCKDVLSTLKGESAEKPPSWLLRLADRATAYSAVIANLPGRDRRLADYRGFVDLVRDLERGLGDVFSVVRRLRRLGLAGAQVARPKLQGLNAVSLMTVHAAKGLEWPFVVVADLDYGRSGGYPGTLIDPHLGVALKLDDDGGQVQEPALYKLIKREKRLQEEAELARVLYVAFTRARDRLLLSAAAPLGAAYKRLSPGFEAISLTFEEVAFDAGLAVYPTETVQRVDNGTLEFLVEA